MKEINTNLSQEVIDYFIELLKFSYLDKNKKILSNQAFRSIVYPMFKNSLTSYSIVYLDANRLNDINEKYGEKEGDEAIHQTTTLMTDALDNNSIMIRLGGDEFIVILCNITKQEAEDQVKKLQEALKSPDNKYNLTYTFGISHFQEGKSFEDIISEAGENQSENKHRYNSDFSDSDINSALKIKVFHGIKNALSTFRLKSFSPEEFEKFEQNLLNLDFLSFSSIKSTSPIKYSSDSNLDSNDAKIVYFSISNVQSGIDRLDLTVLEKLARDITTSPVTGFKIEKALEYNLYRIRQRQEQEDKNYQVVMLSCSGLKRSNLLDSYQQTDTRLYNIAKNYYNALKVGCNNPLDKPGDVIFADCRGGDLLALVNTGKINPDKISEAIRDMDLTDDKMDVVASSCEFSCKDYQELQDLVKSLHEENKIKKVDIKRGLLDKPIASKIFDTYLSDAAKFFVQNFDRKNPEHIQILKDTISESIIELSRQNLTPEKQEHDDER